MKGYSINFLRMDPKSAAHITKQAGFFLSFLSRPGTLLVFVGFLGLFLGGLKDTNPLFHPYRWWFSTAVTVGLLALVAQAKRGNYVREHTCLFWFMVFSAISCAVSPMPEYSFARLGTFMLVFFGIFLAAWVWLQSARNISFLVELFIFSSAIGALFCFYYVLQQQQIIPDTRFSGAFGKATASGSFAAASLPLVLWKREWSKGKWRLFYSFILIILLYTLFFSGARAAIVGGLAALTVWLWKHRPKARIALGLAYTTIGALWLIGVVSLEMLPNYIVRQESLPTFTGRIPRWKVGLALFAESPVIGHGYGMTRYIRLYEEGEENLSGTIVPGNFNLFDYILGVHRERIGRMTLHSDHVERLVESGILGYVPFALFWYFTMMRVVRLFQSPIDANRSLALALGLNVSYLFLDSFMHGALLALNSPGSFLSWLIIVLFLAASEPVLSPSLVRCVSSTSSIALTRGRAVPAIR